MAKATANKSAAAAARFAAPENFAGPGLVGDTCVATVVGVEPLPAPPTPAPPCELAPPTPTPETAPEPAPGPLGEPPLPAVAIGWLVTTPLPPEPPAPLPPAPLPVVGVT